MSLELLCLYLLAQEFALALGLLFLMRCDTGIEYLDNASKGYPWGVLGLKEIA